MQLDLDVAEEHMPGVRLQANELEICRRLPAVDVGVHEIRLLLAV